MLKVSEASNKFKCEEEIRLGCKKMDTQNSSFFFSGSKNFSCVTSSPVIHAEAKNLSTWLEIPNRGNVHAQNFIATLHSLDKAPG